MVKILHVLKWMGRGGAETWLFNVLRNIDREKYQMDFIVQTTSPGDFDSDIKKLGSKIIFLPVNKFRPWTIARDFRNIIKDYGPYDIVHSHVHHFSGFILLLAYMSGVPVRIAHCHDDNSILRPNAGLYRRMYLELTERWIKKYSTIGLACSKPAAVDLFGHNWEIDKRWKIHYCGIDLAPFKITEDRAKVRSELGIPNNAFVVGHVGRFVTQKNHTFLVKIVAEIAKHEPQMRLLLVGMGPLRQDITEQLSKAGLSHRVIFTGTRPDVPRLMLGAMDVFVFPSRWEGLGLVLIEAQAAGVPCVISDVISEEADVIKPLVRRLSIAESPATWAMAALEMRDKKNTITQSEALREIEQSSFNILTSVRELEDLYSHF